MVGKEDGTGFGDGDVIAEGEHDGGLNAVTFYLRGLFWSDGAIVAGLGVCVVGFVCFMCGFDH